MPTQPLSGMVEEQAGDIALLALRVDPDDSDEEELLEQLFLGSCDELGQRLVQEVGPEKLSLARLQRRVAERVAEGDISWNLYAEYGFKSVGDLSAIVDAINPPAGESLRVPTSGGSFLGSP